MKTLTAIAVILMSVAACGQEARRQAEIAAFLAQVSTKKGCLAHGGQWTQLEGRGACGGMRTAIPEDALDITAVPKASRVACDNIKSFPERMSCTLGNLEKLEQELAETGDCHAIIPLKHFMENMSGDKVPTRCD